ncbi:MAG: GAF domain-containing protein [Gaiellales bacterium]|nr:MAG: GAF domain-containing protein [Gaiellales bacterium]
MATQPYAGPDRRKHPRSRQSFPLAFRLYGDDNTSLSASGQAWAYDLSLGGIRLSYQGPGGPLTALQKHSARIDCRLTDGEGKDAWATGRTAWVKPASTSEIHPPAGTAFVGIAWQMNAATVQRIEALLTSTAVPAGSSREQLAALLEVSHLLSSSIDLDQLLRTILDTVSRLLQAEGSSLLLADAATRELIFQMPFDPAGQQLKTHRLRPDEGIAGWVAGHRQPLLVNDVQSDQRFAGKYDQLTGFITRSILGAPLLDRGQVLGVIEVLNSRRPAGFTKEDQDLLVAFAVHAAQALHNAQLVTSIKEEKAYWQGQAADRYRTVIGESQRMQAILVQVRKVAGTPATVLLQGESGVGKEIVARSIHGWSPRAAKPFCAVNCAALSDHLLESELFGHEKGAFTGAHQQKKGLFEIADGGTVFLDEIGEMKVDLQAKMLRVLQDHQFTRVGGSQPLTVDVRVIAATNQDLAEAVTEGRFRKDLFYRLNVVSLRLPPLRERPEDIAPLAAFFVDRFSRELARPRMTLAPDALALLQKHDWPGNVRELENVIERAVIFAAEPDTICATDLVLETASTRDADGGSSFDLPFHESIETHKRELIQHAIAKAGGNKTKAALALKLQPTYLFRLCKQLGIT